MIGVDLIITLHLLMGSLIKELSLDVSWIKLLDLLKMGIVPSTILLLSSSVLLFASEELLSKIGLSAFVENYRSIIGFLWVVSLCAVLIPIIVACLKYFRNWFIKQRRLSNLQSSLNMLSSAEKKVLRKYIKGNTKTQYFDMSDGVVGGLVSSEILYRSSNLSNQLGDFAYNVQPWAWNYLKKHYEILE